MILDYEIEMNNHLEENMIVFSEDDENENENDEELTYVTTISNVSDIEDDLWEGGEGEGYPLGEFADDFTPGVREIYEQDLHFLDSDKFHGQYLIGTCTYSNNDLGYLLSSSVSPRTFFRFSFSRIFQYLLDSSIMYIQRPKVDIIQLNIRNNIYYTAVQKTYWLRLVQRHWKKVFQEIKTKMMKRKTIGAIRHCERYGYFPPECRVIPSLRGMLACYATPVPQSPDAAFVFESTYRTASLFIECQ
jgi:hypothetical protein